MRRNWPVIVFSALLAVVPLVGAQAQTKALIAEEPLSDLTPEAKAPIIIKEKPRALIDRDIAVLRGLDKMTGRTETFEAEVGVQASYERLRIKVKACRVSGPESKPESAVFMQIFDAKNPDDPREVFSGWMFASSPALSAMDHPRFDVWVLNCKSSS